MVAPCASAAYRKACLEHHPDKKLVGVDCEEAKVGRVLGLGLRCVMC
jgi:hypothetical protein